MRARKVDANLSAIVTAARKLGFLVHVTNADWDLTVQRNGRTELWECKRPGLPPSKRATKLQERLLAEGWLIHRIESQECVLRAYKRFTAS